MGGRLGLVLEAGDLPGVEHGGERQHLQRHAAAQRDLLRLVDHAHAAAADLADERKSPSRCSSPAGGPASTRPGCERRAEPGRHVVQLVELSRYTCSGSARSGCSRSSDFRRRRHAALQRRQIAVQNVRQPVLLLGRQRRSADGSTLRSESPDGVHISRSVRTTCLNFSIARSHSMRTAPGLRSMRSAISSNDKPCRLRSTITSRYCGLSLANWSARATARSRCRNGALGDGPGSASTARS